MFHVVLYQPEIPPNTGNVIRLCANTGATLHLVHPLGFELEDARLRRAGLDYREWARVREHASWEAYLEKERPGRVFAFSTRGTGSYADADYRPGDALLFVGTGLLLAAAAIPGWIGAVAFAKWIARLSVSLAQWVKSFFIREEAA